MKRVFVGLSLVLGVLGAGCASSSDVRPAVPESGVRGTGTTLGEFRGVSDWKQADVVAVVRVVEERAVPFPSPDTAYTEEERAVVGKRVFRDLVVEVEEAIRGRFSRTNRLVVEGNYWFEKADGSRQPATWSENWLWLEVGDRALMALSADRNHPNRFGHGSSVFVLRNGEVVDTDRRLSAIRELEALSESELKERTRSEVE